MLLTEMNFSSWYVKFLPFCVAVNQIKQKAGLAVFFLQCFFFLKTLYFVKSGSGNLYFITHLYFYYQSASVSGKIYTPGQIL